MGPYTLTEGDYNRTAFKVDGIDRTGTTWTFTNINSNHTVYVRYDK